jgi:ribonuclease Z
LHIEPVAPGDEIQLGNDLWVRVFRTLHTVPSVGYLLLRKVDKILDEFRDLPPGEIADLRKSGQNIFRTEDRLELAYATDTLIDVLDDNPDLYSSRVLILECTFLDDQKGRVETRRKCHVHLDEVIERAEKFRNEHLVLMHFSQIYSPATVHEIMKKRLPADLASRVRVFAPKKGAWPG